MSTKIPAATVWPITPRTATIHGEVCVELKRRGRVRSQVDMMVAALAIELNLTLLTTDLDFAALPNIKTEYWLSPGTP